MRATLLLHRATDIAVAQVAEGFDPRAEPWHPGGGQSTPAETPKPGCKRNLRGRPGNPSGPPTMNLGEANGSAKLTEDDVRSIRRRHAAGEGRKLLSAAFNISPSMVTLITSRRSWAHVAD